VLPGQNGSMKTSARKALVVLASLVVSLIAFGQACSNDLMTKGLITKASSGNGGGYGGMVSLIGAEYGNGPREGEAPASQIELRSFYLFGQQTSCTQYPAGYEAVGSSIVGILAQNPMTLSLAMPAVPSRSVISEGEESGVAMGFEGSEGSASSEPEPPTGSASAMPAYIYATSVCAMKQDVITGVHQVDFADDYRIYNDDIFLAADTPPTPAQVAQSVASCSIVNRLAMDGAPDPDGIAIGTDILIYNQNNHLTTRLLQGRYASGEFVTAMVAPFVTLENRTDASDTFSAQGFQLVIARNGQKHTTGVLTGLLDGAAISLDMECWLRTP